MKFFLVLLLLPVPAWPQSHASCPLKLPFEVRVQIIGNYLDTSYSTDTLQKPMGAIVLDTNSYLVRIDTQLAGSSYSFVDDSFGFRAKDTVTNMAMGFDSSRIWEIHIIFDAQTATISRLLATYNELVNGLNTQYYHRWEVTCDSLDYSADSIFEQKIIAAKVTLLYDSSSNFQAQDVPPFNHYFWNRELRTGSLKLSSAAALPLSVSQSNPRSDFFFEAEPGAIQCSFSPSERFRSLELCTPLGANVARFAIAPAQTELTLPYLSSGLYFVRMGGDILKIAVP